MKKFVWSLFFGLTIAALAQQPDAQGWITLFNGKDTSGWKLRQGNHNGWSVKEGVLMNQLPSADLISDVLMGNFELHAEFLIPKASNSGLYLQSRYEVQLMDSAGFTPSNIICGAIYEKVAPKQNAAKPAGEWQTIDITFHQPAAAEGDKTARKTRVTVVLNGQKVIDEAELDGPTQGAVGREEGILAGLMLQGDHGPVSFRNLKFRPVK